MGLALKDGSIKPLQTPIFPVEINPNHLLARGLIGAYMPGISRKNYAAGYGDLTSPSTDPLNVIGPYGRAKSFVSANSNRLDTLADWSGKFVTGHSISILVNVKSVSTNYQRFVTIHDSGGNYNGWLQQQASSNEIETGFAGWSFRVADPGSGWHAITAAILYSAITNASSIYIDGVNAVVGSVNPGSIDTGGVLTIGALNAGGWNYGDSDIALVLIHDHRISDNEAMLFAKEPFKVFRRKAISIPNMSFKSWLSSSGPIVYNVNVVAISNSVALAQKSVGKKLNGISNSVGQILKSVSKPLLSVGNSVALLSKNKTTQVAAVATGNSVALISKAVSKSLLAVGNSVALINLIKAKLINVVAISNSVALSKRDVGKTLLAASNSVALIRKTINKSLLGISNAVALCTKAVSKSLLAISNSIALINLIKAKLVNVFATSNSVALTSKTPTKNLTATSNSVALLRRVITVNRAAMSNAVGLIRKDISAKRLAVSNSIAYCMRVIPLRLLAVSNSIAIALIQLANSLYIEWSTRLKSPKLRDRNKTPKPRDRG